MFVSNSARGTGHALAWLLALLSPAVLSAQGTWQEGFESPEAVFREAGADAVYRVNIRRVQGYGRSGDWAESIQLQAANGSFVHVKMPIPPARLLDELRPQLWVKTSRPGIQLLGRVVLPRIVDPQTGRPAEVLLRGSLAIQSDRWQPLTLDNPQLLLNREARALQLELGRQTDVDPRGAYLSELWLNVYGGQGLTDILVDDLEIAGRFPPGDAAEPLLARPDQASPAPAEAIRMQGSVLTLDEQPAFLRLVTHRGEPLSWVKKLGFQGIVLDAPASAALLDEAQQAGCWIVAPPPTGVSGPEVTPAHDRVLAWWWPETQAAPNDAQRKALTDLRQTDAQRQRPIVGAPTTAAWNWSRSLDLLLWERPPVGTSHELGDFWHRLAEQKARARPGTTWWVTVPTELSPAWQEQMRLWTGLPGPGPFATTAQLRLLAFQALASGARALVFTTRNPLDGEDANSRRRAQALALLNLELDYAAPWGAGGEFTTAVQGSESGLTAGLLSLRSSQLLVATWSEPRGQWVLGQAAGRDVSCVLPAVSESAGIYELSPLGMLPLLGERTAGGVRVRWREFGLTSLVVLTSDPQVRSKLPARIAATQASAAGLALDLAQQDLTETRRWMQELASRQPIPRDLQHWLTSAQEALEVALQARAAGDHGRTYQLVQRADRGLRQIQRTLWDEATRGLESPLVSPLAATVATLPEHLAWMDRFRFQTWSANAWPDGNGEDLDRFTQAGWRPQIAPREDFEGRAELTVDEPLAGKFSIRLEGLRRNAKAVAAAVVDPEIVALPLVRLTSPEVRVEPGQMVRVRGWLRIIEPGRGAQTRLEIQDTLGGPDLALRFGPTKGWQPFCYYRLAGQAASVQVSFALAELGRVDLDDLALETLTLTDEAADRADVFAAPAEPRFVPEAVPRRGLPRASEAHTAPQPNFLPAREAARTSASRVGPWGLFHKKH